ncbi:MAG: peptide deformylase [Chloroflexi bacterium]|nr:peptide deformylase [Chloroflexota bacterium]
MAVREILLYSENKKALRKKSKPVEGIDQDLKQLIADLKDTLNACPEGIGLAAPQINVHKRVVLVRLGATGNSSGEPGLPIPLISPKIIEAGDERKDFDGCLSFPGLYGETFRPHHLRVTGVDEGGQPFDQVYDGFDAAVVHHEIDHLDGVLFIDRIENWKDLYTQRTNENGELVRVPVTVS